MVAKDILGSVAMVATLSQVLVGMTSQVRTLYRERSTRGLSMVAIATAGFGFSAWTVYSIWQPINLYVLIPNSLGAVLSAIILVQMGAIRRRGPRIQPPGNTQSA
jgi:uncharacterized protein with PQ loop repeat